MIANKALAAIKDKYNAAKRDAVVAYIKANPDADMDDIFEHKFDAVAPGDTFTLGSFVDSTLQSAASDVRSSGLLSSLWKMLLGGLLKKDKEHIIESIRK